MRYAFIIALLLATVAKADTLLISTANFNDLNPERDATTANAFETIRITHTITDGAELLPLTTATSMPLYIELTAGGWTTAVFGATSTNSPGVVRWQIPGGLNAGQYRLRGWVFFPADSFPVYDRFLTVTSTPAQASVINITNEVNVGEVTITNIFGDTYITNIVSSDINITNTFAPVTTNITVITNIIQLDNITSEITVSNNYFFSGLGNLYPYTIDPESPVTVSPTNGWWQVLTATGATQILLASKADTNEAASVRLDYYTLHATTITNIENFASLSISTSRVNVLLFDNPANRGITNWIVEQLY
jgi:hypothetical protein